ncbi:membrane protein [Mannheimia granulomatis]|uniref:Probable membrane transporter protein n=1 Tax=Mannheimia granulomatis TaxID=85402 RepID=A0A011NCH9_9PAST|nr:TSUP family transporter [Mannheimia granulomatis]EXI62095.1 membrane protein [Mannheimia granulomatis]RGE48660.1 membrane protein [Mannheimia granulomatis]
MELGMDILAILFAVGMLAGFIDAIAGGGGLLTIPALMAAGLPPAMALGTNKLQACGGSFSSSFYFIRKKAVNLKQIWYLILFTFIGSAAGTVFVQHIDVEFLKKLLPFLILIIGIYFLFSPTIGDEDRKQRISLSMFAFVDAALGFYDGMFGPAAGSFMTLAFILLLGFNLSKSVAHAKVINFTSNFASLIFFTLGGAVVWKVGLIMMVGQFIGGTLGAKMVMTKGKQLIRPMLVTMSFAMVAKMLYEQGIFN